MKLRPMAAAVLLAVVGCGGGEPEAVTTTTDTASSSSSATYQPPRFVGVIDEFSTCVAIDLANFAAMNADAIGTASALTDRAGDLAPDLLEDLLVDPLVRVPLAAQACVDAGVPMLSIGPHGAGGG